MVDMSMISGAMSALKAAGETAKLIVASHDAGVIRQKVLELQTQILAAQSGALAAQSDQFTLLERVSDLEKQIADVKAWDTEKVRYELKAIDAGAFVYSLKVGVSDAEIPHWICTNCYEDGKKSILQQGRTNRDVFWRCSACTAIISAPSGRCPEDAD